MHDDVLGNLALLTEILLRLPVKDAVRCKCVCKKWMSLISKPQFCYRHTLGLCPKHKHKNNPNTYLYPSGMLGQEGTLDSFRNKKAFVIPFTNNTNNNCRFIHLNVDVKLEGTFRYRLLQSCNGLQLWVSIPVRPSPPYDAKAKKLLQRRSCFYVNNSSTGRCVRIDQFDYEHRFSKAYLAFEPWRSPHYKVFFFECEKMNVYSSAIGSWIKLDILPYFLNNKCGLGRGDALYFNGAVHWYNPHGNAGYFNIDLLYFKKLPQLPIPHEKLKVMLFGESGGNLYLIPNNYNNDCRRYDIWELKEDYSEWILKYHIDRTTLERGFLRVDLLRVIRQPPNEDEQEESICAILVYDKKLVSYNLKDHSWKILYENNDGICLSDVKELYFETLTSI